MSDNKFKGRKNAHRTAFQERRKPWIDARRFALDEATSDPLSQISISSESNSSTTDAHDTLDGLDNYEDSSRLNAGCSVWNDQQLNCGLEDKLVGNYDAIRKTKSVFQSNDEATWASLPSAHYDSATLFAAINGHIRMLRFLLKVGANPRTTDSDGRTALHYAASCSASASAAAECIQLLVNHGAQVDCWDKHGLATPLICASAKGNCNSVNVLLRCGADVNAGLNDPKYSDASTALVWAVRSRSANCAQLLIDKGAAINNPKAYSEAAIHVAASQADEKCLQILLKNNADVRVLLGANRMSALHLAAEEGNAECIKILLAAKADCNATNLKGQTALHLASLSQSVESVAFLLDFGARLDIRDCDLKTALHSAVIKSSRSTDIVRLLINAGD